MNRLIVALDVDSRERALSLVGTLNGAVGAFKIGSHFYTSHGPSFVEALVAAGERVFLDLKFHDIPNTVGNAVTAATRLGVWMVNVHASGGTAMMRAARDAAHNEAAKIGRTPPLVIAVTVLTSFNDVALQEIGVSGTVASQVERLANAAKQAGLDGIVASPQEVTMLRNRMGTEFVIVTPGVRGGAAPRSAKGDDQERTLTAGAALAAGSTYLVVGRPILEAADPRAAAERIGEECRTATAR